MVNDRDEQIIRHGLFVIQSETAKGHDYGDEDGGSASSGTQLGPATKAVSDKSTLLIFC